MGKKGKFFLTVKYQEWEQEGGEGDRGREGRELGKEGEEKRESGREREKEGRKIGRRIKLGNHQLVKLVGESLMKNKIFTLFVIILKEK